MDLQQLQDFFFWCMLINFGIYTATAIATFAFRGMLVKIQQRLFGFDEAATLNSVQSYLATISATSVVRALCDCSLCDHRCHHVRRLNDHRHLRQVPGWDLLPPHR